jgi:hypothetical protein
MKKLLIFAGVLLTLAFVCVAGFLGLALYAAANAPQLTPTPELTVIREAWVSRFHTCPDDPNYGRLASHTLNLYSSPDLGLPNVIAEIQHGDAVEVLQEGETVVFIRWQGLEGYVDAWFVTDYDPATGVQPDESHCF